MTTSSLTGFGFGCEANSKSLAESLSVRALSTGPKTLLLSFWLFDFFVLARAPFAILEALVANRRLGNLFWEILKVGLSLEVYRQAAKYLRNSNRGLARPCRKFTEEATRP
jgi:hypothetical protein